MARLYTGLRKLIVRDSKGKLVKVATVMRATATRYATKGGKAYLIKTGKEVGGSNIATLVTSEADLVAAEAELDRLLEEAEQRRDAEAKAAYDALPEAIKLARKIRWFCDSESEEAVSFLPLDVLRKMDEAIMKFKTT